MRRKMKWRVLASACAAAMAVTSLPYMATQVNAEPVAATQQTGDNDLKLWYKVRQTLPSITKAGRKSRFRSVMAGLVERYSAESPENVSSSTTNRFGQEDQAPADRTTMEVTWRIRGITDLP